MAFGIQPDFLLAIKVMILDIAWSPCISIISDGVGYRKKLMIARRDGFHHMDPWPLEDCIVEGLYVNHIEHGDDVYRSARTGIATMAAGEHVSFSLNPYR